MSGPSCRRCARKRWTSTSAGDTASCTASAAAVPAAWPMAMQVPITRAPAIPSWVAEMQRPELSRLGTETDSSAR